MKRTCALTVAAALAAIPALASDHAKGKTVAITGCLERDTASASNSTATTTTTTTKTTTAGTTGAERFVLIKGEQGPAGGNPWRADSPNGAWYFVVGRSGKLRRDAKKVVEVNGRLDETDKGAGVASTRSNPPAGTLHMTSIKVLSGSCGE